MNLFPFIVAGLVLTGNGLLLRYESAAQEVASTSILRVTANDEPGKPFTLDITVRDLDTKEPVPGASVFMYQTNHVGDYESERPADARIKGTVVSDSNGRVRFITIYPRGYNNSPTGEHMHFRITAKGYLRSVADLIFADYYRKRYNFSNPYTYKVYLHELIEKNGKLTGNASVYLKVIK
jgi:protocatechuate 3,4-dioxygenase beta subunit